MKNKNPVQIFTGISLLHPHRLGWGPRDIPRLAQAFPGHFSALFLLSKPVLGMTDAQSYLHISPSDLLSL